MTTQQVQNEKETIKFNTGIVSGGDVWIENILTGQVTRRYWIIDEEKTRYTTDPAFMYHRVSEFEEYDQIGRILAAS